MYRECYVGTWGSVPVTKCTVIELIEFKMIKKGSQSN